MKSLDWVTETLEFVEKRHYAYHIIYPNELQQIKQDLEVLEIIRKKKVDVSYLLFYLKVSANDKIALSRYNAPVTRIELTMEELLKLKQWLEENEQYVIE